MIDGHIHLEKGPYTIDWVKQFADKAVEMKIDEIWLLEHCYRFREFVPMYGEVTDASEYIDTWFRRKAGQLDLKDYLTLIEAVRKETFPVTVRFGLEICYFEEYEELVYDITKDTGFDFLLGSVHFAGCFAFDHKAEYWNGVDVDRVYASFFDRSVHLAESGLFDGIAHPDSIKLFGHRPSFPLGAYYESLATALEKQHMYAEENSGTYRRARDTSPLGMERELLKALKSHNVPIITASDAHHPEDVGDRIAEMEALISH